ncbi:MAG: hypothetical protein IPH97_04245 [Ignavibacteriales bacterium]|nr:hypothetical protein [Ignavibacteriales bacterium]
MLKLTKLFFLTIILYYSTDVYSQQSTDTTRVLLRFNEPMSREGIFEISNYHIINSENQIIKVFKVGIVQGDSAVVLFTEKSLLDKPVQIIVNNLKDKSGNLISENHNLASIP